jgi:hypothetical protein
MQKCKSQPAYAELLHCCWTHCWCRPQVVEPSPLPTDITPVAASGTQQAGSSSSSTSITGLVVGLSIAGVLTGCIGGLLVVLLRHRHNTRRRVAEHIKQQQQAAAQHGLVRHGSGGSSNGSGVFPVFGHMHA